MVGIEQAIVVLEINTITFHLSAHGQFQKFVSFENCLYGEV